MAEAAELLIGFQKIMRSGTVPREWGDCLTIPYHNQKVDELQCGKYRFEAVGAWYENLVYDIIN